MEDVAQSAEHKVVALGVAGSSPVILLTLRKSSNGQYRQNSNFYRLFYNLSRHSSIIHRKTTTWLR